MREAAWFARLKTAAGHGNERQGGQSVSPCCTVRKEDFAGLKAA
jgi:hypothetical protein